MKYNIVLSRLKNVSNIVVQNIQRMYDFVLHLAKVIPVVKFQMP